MARGNWHDRYRPKPRCRKCWRAITRRHDLVRVGYKPYHRDCAQGALLDLVLEAACQAGEV